MKTNALIGHHGRAIIIQDLGKELQIAIGSESHPIIAENFPVEDVLEIVDILEDWIEGLGRDGI